MTTLKQRLAPWAFSARTGITASLKSTQSLKTAKRRIMTPEERRKILRTVCSDSYMDPICQEPYQLQVDDTLYEFAMDDHLVMAFEVRESELPAVPEKRGTAAQSIAGWMRSKPTHTIPPKAFADFLKLDECRYCPMCSGSGQRPLESPSEYEYGINDPLDDVRYVEIGGYLMNANLLAKTMIWLNIADLKTLLVRIDPVEKVGARFTFYGDGWILVQMGVRHTAVDPGGEPLPEWNALEVLPE